MKVKEQYGKLLNGIEVYIPASSSNFKAIKEHGKYYKHSTNSDDVEVDFVVTEMLSNTARIFTK